MLELMMNSGNEKSNNKDFQFWQQHNHQIELSSNDIIQQKVDYIHENPVKAGFVKMASDWIWSSASDYEGRKGLIDIFFLD